MTSTSVSRALVVAGLCLASLGGGCAGGRRDAPQLAVAPVAAPQPAVVVAESAPDEFTVPPSEKAREFLAALRTRLEKTKESPLTGASGRDDLSLLPPGSADGFHPDAGGLRAHFAASIGHASARVLFPRRATAPLHVEDVATGFGVDVGLVGAREAEAQVADGYVVYPNAHASGAALLHRALPVGAEDFLSFDKRPRAATVAYTIALSKGVRGLRLVANTLELLDAGGAPRLRVAPPYLMGADGVRTDAVLAVEGCAVDKNAAGPWGRRVAPPGATTCTLRVSWDDNAVDYPALLDPRWTTTTGAMVSARQGHTATLLSTGKVLVAGGRTSSTSTTGLATAELFDRTTGTWAATGSMTGGRWFHSAVQLNASSNTTTGGKVLIAGGITGTASQNTAQLYSPTAGTWVAATNLNTARHQHTATLLASGQVLVAGGVAQTSTTTTVLNTAALYNPASGSGTWAATGNMATARKSHSATLLVVPGNATLNNRVLVVGGNSGGTTSVTSVQLFDGTAWSTPTGIALATAREGHTATALANGNVLITGGKSGSTVLNTAFLFNGASGSGTWTAAGTMTSKRQAHTATLLPASIVASGQVLLVGGSDGTSPLTSAELWNGTTTWTATTALPAAVQDHTATLLANSAVLIAGGATTPSNTARIYDPSFALACTSNSQCTTGFCVSGVCCDTACTNSCSACNLTGLVGTCSPKPNGATCSDNNACTTGETCQTGTCSGGTVKTCTASDQCHVAGVCDTTTGACSNPNAGNGISCNDNNACTTGETCQAGACSGGTVKTCAPSDQCHVAGVCNTTTGACSNPNAGNGTACNDGNACTTGETCQAGLCSSGTAKTCPASDQCHVAGVCNTTTGACSNPAAGNGIACNDGNACTTGETCQAGLCSGGTNKTCTASDQCHTAGTCDPASGACSNPVASNGTSCSDGNACTQTDTCQNGSCAGGNPKTCAAVDQCHAAGTCNTTTGACSAGGALADATACNDGNACTQSDTCVSGACQGGQPVACTGSGNNSSSNIGPAGGSVALEHASLQVPAGALSVAKTITITSSAKNPPAGTQAYTPIFDFAPDGTQFSAPVTVAFNIGLGAINPVIIWSRPGGGYDDVGGAYVNGVITAQVTHFSSGGVIQSPCQGKADGTLCSDGNGCTSDITGFGDTNDTCRAGKCVPGQPVVCESDSACRHAGVCNPDTGMCPQLTAEADGNGCNDGNVCTVGDTCHGGTCIPGAPTACSGEHDTYYAPLTDLGSVLGQSVAMDINEQGMIVGTDSPGHDNSSVAWFSGGMPSRAFRWTEQGGMQYEAPVGVSNVAFGMNASGAFTGVSNGDGPLYRWLNVLRSDPAPGGPAIVRTYAGGVAINDAGVIVGYGYFTGQPQVRMFRMAPGQEPEVLLPPPGSPWVGVSAPHAIDSQGNVVGYATDVNSSDAVAVIARQDGLVIDLNEPLVVSLLDPDHHWRLVEARAIHFNPLDGSNTILGNGTYDGTPHAFRLTMSGSLIIGIDDLGTMPPYDGPNSYIHMPIPHRANSHNEVVGAFYDIYGMWPYVAFIHVPGQGIIKLNDLLPPNSGWNLSSAFAINDNREIVGFGYLNGEARGYRMKFPDLSPCPAKDSCHALPKRDPATGLCSDAPPPALADGTACQLGGGCGAGERCKSGQCIVPSSSACSNDICDPQTGAITHVIVAAGTPCGDGDACNGTETCDDAGVCHWGQIVKLSDNNPCTTDLCDPLTGTVSHLPVAAGISCSDGNPCNGAETCSPDGQCQAGLPLADGTICDNVSACMSLSVCEAGSCTGMEASSECAFANQPPPSLADVLAGKIVPATGAQRVTGPTIAAGIPGTLNVEADGAASYQIPLWVPEGVRGLRPQLSIAYNSNQNFGLLGKRWTVGGLSTISRCPKTLQTDGIKGPVDIYDHNGDEFCLDGTRLSRFSGQRGGTGEFRTSVNPFQKIVATDADDVEIRSFKVFQPDGMVFYYGRTAASRLTANGTNFPIDVPQSLTDKRTLIYYLDKVVDRFGNSILLSYQAGPAAASGQPTTPTNEVQVLEPSLIQWGGQDDSPGLRSVKFEYLTPDATAAGRKAQQQWVSGVGVSPPDHLKTISMFGPDGSDSPPSLIRRYKFGYDNTKTITNESLLATISECDGNDVCKAPTSITWDPGSWTHQRSEFDLPDVTLPHDFNEDQNARVLTADLDGDGKDDLIYRTYIDAQRTSQKCLGWMGRLSKGDKFGDSFVINLGTDPDLGCGTNPSDPGFGPYPGDIILADITGDGLADIISPAGYLGIFGPGFTGNLGPNLYFYNAYINTTPFPGDPTTLSKVTFVNALTNDPSIALGDLDGDGLPEVIRPTEFPGKLNVSKISKTGSTTSTMPAVPNSQGIFSVLDLDGDGVAEILRKTTDATTVITGHTVQGSAVIPATPDIPKNQPQSVRWFLDLNGDGLLDVAYVMRSDPTSLVTQINTGRGFGKPTSVAAPIGQQWMNGLDSGVRIADANHDGRQDLVLVDGGTQTITTPFQTRVLVLLSDGSGHFNQQLLQIKIGAPSSGYRPQPMPYDQVSLPDINGYRTTTVADVNGDGLPDIVQFEKGKLVVYFRQGNVPDVVTAIGDGQGRNVSVTYTSLSDAQTYTRDPSSCAIDPVHLTCINKGMPVTKSVTETGGTVSKTKTFMYSAALADRLGGGFLGFSLRDIYESMPSGGTVHTIIESTPGQITAFNEFTGYIFPLAFAPNKIRTEVDTPQGPNSHHSFDEITTRTIKQLVWPDNPTFLAVSVLPTSVVRHHYDCPNGQCGHQTRRLLQRSDINRVFDDYGNATSVQVTHLDDAANVVQSDTRSTTFYPPDTDHWLIHLASQVATTSVVPASGNRPQESVTRTETITPDFTVNNITNLPTGGIASVEIEPYGDSTVHRLRIYTPDERGRLQTIIDKDPATGEQRMTKLFYEDADGVYVTTTTDAMGLGVRTYRHPSLGVVVETLDPNNLPSSATYDSFGRLRSYASTSGSTSTMTYSDDVTDGTRAAVTPEGMATRAISVELNPFGMETKRNLPIDQDKRLIVESAYDSVGRMVSQKYTSVKYTSPTSVTLTSLNEEDIQYDDLGRVLSSCHDVSAGVGRVCRTVAYDGFGRATTDESNRKVTETVDAMGRLAIQHADLDTGGSDSVFRYGPFGQLESQVVDATIGYTSIKYDVLGRPFAVERKLTGVRRTEYNPFGDVTKVYKETSGGQALEVESYGRDRLGRMTSQTSTGGALAGLNRHFYWDVDQEGHFVSSGMGKLVDVVDANSKVSLHMDYNSGGLLETKTWSINNLTNTAKETYALGFTYTPQGRVATMRYPAVPGSTSSLGIKYGYDDYSGATSSIVDLDDQSADPLWRADTRNELGEITKETMKLGGPAIVRSSSYYLQDGRLQNTGLNAQSGSNAATAAQIAYKYFENGQTKEIDVAGEGASWQSTFQYDNLGRLTAWQPDMGTPTVQYGYDGDGNLSSRQWSNGSLSETVNYGVSSGAANSRTVTVTKAGEDPRTDVYKMDSVGRVFDTPAVELRMTDDDLIGQVHEKGSGRVDTLVYDALGNRVETIYGQAGEGGTLVTLDSLFQLRRGGGIDSEVRWKLTANGKLIGEVVSTAGGPRTATFYLEDGVHSVVAEMSSQGNVALRRARDPFGNTIVDLSAPSLPNEPGDNAETPRLGFGGHERDGEWGTIDMLARAYSPRLGRFMSPDAIIGRLFDRRFHNPYAYVLNDPTNLDDPSGNWTVGGLYGAWGPTQGGDVGRKDDDLFSLGSSRELTSPVTELMLAYNGGSIGDISTTRDGGPNDPDPPTREPWPEPEAPETPKPPPTAQNPGNGQDGAANPPPPPTEPPKSEPPRIILAGGSPSPSTDLARAANTTLSLAGLGATFAQTAGVTVALTTLPVAGPYYPMGIPSGINVTAAEAAEVARAIQDTKLRMGSPLFRGAMNVAKIGSNGSLIVSGAQGVFQIATGHGGLEAAFTVASGIASSYLEVVAAGMTVAVYGAELGAMAGPVGALVGLALGAALGTLLALIGRKAFGD